MGSIILILLVCLFIFLIHLTEKNTLTYGMVLSIKRNYCYVKSISLNKIIKCKYNKQINIGDSVSAMKHLHTWYII